MHGEIEGVAHFCRERDLAGTTGHRIEREGIEAAALSAGVASSEVRRYLHAKGVGERADEDADRPGLRTQDRRPARDYCCARAKQRSARNALHGQDRTLSSVAAKAQRPGPPVAAAF